MVSVKRAKTHLVFLSDSLHALQELAPRATQSLSSIGNQVYEWQSRSKAIRVPNKLGNEVGYVTR